MKSKLNLLTSVSVCAFIILGAASEAFAQDIPANSEEDIIKTRSVKVTASQTVSPYVAEKGVNSGKSVIEGEAVSDNARASGDANEILRILPHIQFDNNKNDASQEALQEIHPLDISISGGKYYENNISIDGIGVNTRLDVTEAGSPAALNEVAGSRAQTQWVDTSLIDKIEVMDSNISAEYGQFTGGVVNVNTRNPAGKYGINANTSCTGDDLTSFKISKITRAAIGDEDIAAKPEYQRCNLGISVDLPQIYGVNLMVAHNEQFSEVVYNKAATYGGGEYRQTSKSKTTMIKAVKDFGDIVSLQGSITHSPYSSEFQNSNQVANQIITYGGGDRATISLKSLGTPLLRAKEWAFNVSYSDDDTSREAADNHYSWPSSVSEFKICSNTNCSWGGFGNIDQNEKELKLNAKMVWNVPFGDLRVGVGYENVDASKVREKNSYAYLTSVTGSNIVCGTSGDTACRDGSVVLTSRLTYLAYDINVSLDTANVWTEWDAKFGNLSVRTGLRADYDSFLENTDIAPRFTTSYDFGRFELFGGANRYYTKSFLGYAIREQMPDLYRYTRSATTSGTSKIYYDTNWVMTLHSRGTVYSDADLKTPYSDELSAGINAELPWGVNSRIKYINRENKDLIAVGERVAVSYVNEATGKTGTYYQRAATNDGHSKYESISIELFRDFGKNHRLSFNTAWSDLNSYGDTYFDDSIYDESYVYYNGEVITFEEMYNIKQQSNFNTPLMLNLTLNSKWLNGRLKSNISLRWRDGYETIDDSGETTTVDGTDYEVYTKLNYKQSTEFDLKLDYELISQGRNKVIITANVTNVFDNTQYPIARTSTNPYEKGRTIWLGANYKF